MRSTWPALFFLLSALSAQTPSKAMYVFLPDGQGGIPVHVGDGWTAQSAMFMPDEQRIIVQRKNDSSGLIASYILFPWSPTPVSAEDCRKAVVPPLLQGLQAAGDVKDVKSTYRTNASGVAVPLESYLVRSLDDRPVNDKNVFAFASDGSHCAELHLSKVNYKPEDDPKFQDELERFQLDVGYAPSFVDYFGLASVFYRGQDWRSAAMYYQRAFETMPSGTDRKLQRLLVDQLAMSYGLSGDVKRSRDVNEAAIARDPEYPLYYYNLACADAENGDAAGAKKHLTEAFARRENSIEGHMPDPTQDDSFRKLKRNKDFWAFLQTLPKS